MKYTRNGIFPKGVNSKACDQTLKFNVLDTNIHHYTVKKSHDSRKSGKTLECSKLWLMTMIISRSIYMIVVMMIVMAMVVMEMMDDDDDDDEDDDDDDIDLRVVVGGSGRLP